MQYEIVKVPEKFLLGIGLKTTNENKRASKDIAKVWKEIWNKDTFLYIENKKNKFLYGLYTKYEGDYTKPYYYYVCCEITDAVNTDEKMSVFSIPETKYAKFSIRGNYMESVEKLWNIIWKTELERKYTYDFELYHLDGETPDDQLLEIYIAIKE